MDPEAATQTQSVAAAETNVVMLVVSGSGPDTQWFDYRPGFFYPVIRVEWEKDTMFAALPDDVAGYLLSHGYARAMTETEIEEYTAPPPPTVESATEPATEPVTRKSKKGDKS